MVGEDCASGWGKDAADCSPEVEPPGFTDWPWLEDESVGPCVAQLLLRVVGIDDEALIDISSHGGSPDYDSVDVLLRDNVGPS